MNWVIYAAPRPLIFREYHGTHCLGGWVGPGPFWRAAKNLAPTGTRSADRSTRSESLYRLRYPGPTYYGVLVFFFTHRARKQFRETRNIKFCLLIPPNKDFITLSGHSKQESVISYIRYTKRPFSDSSQMNVCPL